MCHESLPPSRLSFSPLASPLVLHLNRASACKVRAPSCEGLSLSFSQAAERQQAVSKSVPRVTCVEEAVRAREELRHRRLPHLAACQGRSTLCEHPLSVGRFQGWESAQHQVLFWHSEEHPAAEGCGGSGGDCHQAALLHPGFGIVSLSNLQEGSESNVALCPHP